MRGTDRSIFLETSMTELDGSYLTEQEGNCCMSSLGSVASSGYDAWELEISNISMFKFS